MNDAEWLVSSQGLSIQYGIVWCDFPRGVGPESGASDD